MRVSEGSQAVSPASGLLHGRHSLSSTISHMLALPQPLVETVKTTQRTICYLKTEKGKRNNGKQMHNQNMQKSFFPTKRKKAIVRHGLADVKFIFDPKKECRKHRIDII